MKSKRIIGSYCSDLSASRSIPRRTLTLVGQYICNSLMCLPDCSLLPACPCPWIDFTVDVIVILVRGLTFFSGDIGRCICSAST